MLRQMLELAPSLVYGLGRLEKGGVTLLGTAFALPKQGLLATTAHAVRGDTANLVLIQSRAPRLSDYQDMDNLPLKTTEATVQAVDPFRDIAIVEVDGQGFPSYQIEGTDALSVGDTVVGLGFPQADQGRFVLTQQIAHVGAKVFGYSEGVRTKQAVLNMQARPGQSGGPVFHGNTGALCALLLGPFAPGAAPVIIAGIDPLTLHQTTHAVSAEYISEMI